MEKKRLLGYGVTPLIRITRLISLMCNRKVQNIVLIAVLFLHQSVQAEWLSPYYLDHPLVGRVFSLQKMDWVTIEQVESRINETQYLLLGEIHTNPDHHRGQAELIRQWISARNNQATIVLEMLNVDQWREQPAIWTNIQELEKAFNTVASIWNWDLYQPILALAVEKQIPIMAANLTKEQRSFYRQEGNCKLEQHGKEFAFCDTMSAGQVAELENLISQAHCGYLQAEHLPPLVKTQIAKDVSFALSLHQAGLHSRAVLIAGAIHVRKDIGVPYFLQKLGKDSVSVTFMSVDPEKTNAEEYFDTKLGLPFDYIYFTPSERNLDPCEEFADQLKNMNK